MNSGGFSLTNLDCGSFICGTSGDICSFGYDAAATDFIPTSFDSFDDIHSENSSSSPRIGTSDGAGEADLDRTLLWVGMFFFSSLLLTVLTFKFLIPGIIKRRIHKSQTNIIEPGPAVFVSPAAQSIV